MRPGFRGLAAGAALGVAASSSLAAELAKTAAETPRLGTCGVTGGFVLPGTDACLTIGGFVRAEGAWRLTSAPALAGSVAGPAWRPAGAATDHLDRSALGASARLTTDVRMPTELGPVRVFVSLRGLKGATTDRAAH